MKLTAFIEKSDDGWYVGQIQEFPAAMSQGKTIRELKKNLLDALYELMEANREEMEKIYKGREVRKEALALTR